MPSAIVSLYSVDAGNQNGVGNGDEWNLNYIWQADKWEDVTQPADVFYFRDHLSPGEYTAAWTNASVLVLSIHETTLNIATIYLIFIGGALGASWVGSSWIKHATRFDLLTYLATRPLIKQESVCFRFLPKQQAWSRLLINTWGEIAWRFYCQHRWKIILANGAQFW
jgi:hypothetical protein